jgi:hypothetical protein
MRTFAITPQKSPSVYQHLSLLTLLIWLSGGRTWWAHFEFTRINITPTILPKKIEDLRVLRQCSSSLRCRSASSSHCAIFSSFAAWRAQPCAVPFQRWSLMVMSMPRSMRNCMAS